MCGDRWGKWLWKDYVIVHSCRTRKGKKGSILVDGKPFFKDHPVAYVPQENPLVEELSVRDNLLLWYKGDRKKMEKDLADGPAAILGIPQMLKKTAGQLSGGMKKRAEYCLLPGFRKQIPDHG